LNGQRLGLVGLVLVIIGAVMIAAGSILASNPRTGSQDWSGGMMGSFGHNPGMMGAYRGGLWTDNAPQPGDQGFVAGTAETPRVIRVVAGPDAFTPSAITVQRGETVRFEVTTMGHVGHEFMLGPADAVAADQAGWPEIADIGMMQTRSLTYTFDGPGPYAFACHVPGHYEAGMHGTIAVVG
jgi:plastocyanin